MLVCRNKRALLRLPQLSIVWLPGWDGQYQLWYIYVPHLIRVVHSAKYRLEQCITIFGVLVLYSDLLARCSEAVIGHSYAIVETQFACRTKRGALHPIVHVFWQECNEPVYNQHFFDIDISGSYRPFLQKIAVDQNQKYVHCITLAKNHLIY